MDASQLEVRGGVIFRAAAMLRPPLWYDRNSMTCRRYKMLWLIIAVAMTVQAVAPSIALAQVSVRCAGAPVSATPCARAVLALDTGAPAVIKCPDMSCCRSKAKLMRACAMSMSMDITPPTSPAATAASMPRCVISITPFGSTQPANKVIHNRWLLTTAPAIGPPACVDVSTPSPDSISIPLPKSAHLSASFFTRSHALRAPPVA